MPSVNLLRRIDPTDSDNIIMEKDLRFTTMAYGKRIESYYLAYIPLSIYETLPKFGALDLISCFTVNFFYTEEYPLGVILLFNQLCNCISSVFYLPVTMFQYICEYMMMEKLWECYYDVLKSDRNECSREIKVQNWKTSTILNIRLKKQYDVVRICLSYIDCGNLNGTTRNYSTDALSFLDYCQFFYRRFVNPVLETNNYAYDCSKVLPVT